MKKSNKNMTILVSAAKQLAVEELKRANEIHGPHTSLYQAYGALKEELEEAEEQKENLDDFISLLWHLTKKDDYGSIEYLLDEAEPCLLNQIAESIQALAMIYKFKVYLSNRGVGEVRK